MLAGPGLLAFQAFVWLKTGNWMPLPLSELLQYLPDNIAPIMRPFVRWLSSPHDWIGVHRLVAWILDLPLSAAAMIIGGIICGTGAVLYDRSK